MKRIFTAVLFFVLSEMVFARSAFEGKWISKEVHVNELLNVFYDVQNEGCDGIHIKLVCPKTEAEDFYKYRINDFLKTPQIYFTLDLTECECLVEVHSPKLLDVTFSDLNGITEIDFSDCTNLKSITFPEKELKVTLDNCVNLETINCNPNLTTFVSLRNCAKLKEVKMAFNWPFLNLELFSLNGCRSLKKVTIYGELKGRGFFDESAFQNCDSLVEVKFANPEENKKYKDKIKFNSAYPYASSKSFDKKRTEYVFNEDTFDEEILRDDAFWVNCEYIKMGNSITGNYFTIDGILFKKITDNDFEYDGSDYLSCSESNQNYALLKFPPQMKKEKLVLSEKCVDIRKHAFADAQFLKRLDCPGVVHVGNSAFSKMKNQIEIVDKPRFLWSEHQWAPGNESLCNCKSVFTDKEFVTEENLRMRKGPTLYSDSICTVPKGTKLKRVSLSYSGPLELDENNTKVTWSSWAVYEILEDTKDIKGNLVKKGSRAWMGEIYIRALD